MSVTPAVSDIRLSTALRSHRKIKRLRRKLGGSGCWALACLWMFAGEQRWDGDLSGLSDDDLEEEADWDGAPGAFIAALLDCRLLTGPGGERRIHDWSEHQPFAASRGSRIESAKKAARARWGDKAPTGDRCDSHTDEACESDAGRMRGGFGSHETAMPPTQPNPTDLLKDPSDPSRACAREAGSVGCFEPAEEVPRETPATPTPAGTLAIALGRAGFRVTSINPTLLAYLAEGGTVEHATAVAAFSECQGKPASYVLAFARRELAEAGRAPPVGTSLTTTGGSVHPVRPRRLSKQAEGMLALERMKSKHRGTAP